MVASVSTNLKTFLLPDISIFLPHDNISSPLSQSTSTGEWLLISATNVTESPINISESFGHFVNWGKSSTVVCSSWLQKKTFFNEQFHKKNSKRSQFVEGIDAYKIPLHLTIVSAKQLLLKENM